ncbi:MAG: hypothetical protein H6698_03380 [Myxococcales bacterium]|nr:hypothetical protein [Myxococcales bacterium]MCB9533355.1 hypothetical protein [Myxococcales bacterium]
MRAIKAKLSKFSTLDEYVQGWGQYYYSGGILLPTRSAEEPGTAVSLNIQIANGETVLRGEGVVQEARTNSAGETVGMVIRFTRLDPRSKDLVGEILARKKEVRHTSSEAAVEEPEPLPTPAAGPGAPELGAIAAAIDETFDSIFTGSFTSVGADTAAGFFGPGDSEPGPDAELAATAPATPDELATTAPAAKPQFVAEPAPGFDPLAAPLPPPRSAASTSNRTAGRSSTVDAVNEALERLGIARGPNEPPHPDALSSRPISPVRDREEAAAPSWAPGVIDDRTEDGVASLLAPAADAAPEVPDEAGPAPPADDVDTDVDEHEDSPAPVDDPRAPQPGWGAPSAPPATAAPPAPAGATPSPGPATSLEPATAAPQGLIAKLIAWFKRLFGG